MPHDLDLAEAVDGLTASIEKMRAAGVPDAAIQAFRHYYERLRAGDSGVLPESRLEPAQGLTVADDLGTTRAFYDGAGRTIKTFAVRARAPLFDTAPFDVVGRPTADGKGAELWTVTPKGTIAAQATATLA